MKRNRVQDSRAIWKMFMGIFITVALSMLFSTYYMNQCIQREEEAQTMRARYRQLGEDLRDASDYLTAEVRYFAVTRDMTHLYHYWNEIYVDRRREAAIAAFEESSPPEDEKKLLEEAKTHSDLLVETETYSMKLVLLSMGISDSEGYDEETGKYVETVLAYEIPDDISGLSPDEMLDRAVMLLYDDAYEDYKEQIMTPIDAFTEQMNSRMDREVAARQQGTRAATICQIILAAAAVLAIGFMIRQMNQLYILPLKSYTEAIRCNGEAAQKLGVRIQPRGALELISFAGAFNRMTASFLTELKHRREAEERMRTAMQEARKANEAKSIFLAQMSHELRTPLNAVNGYAFLLKQTTLTQQQKKYTEGISYASKGLLELINQILDFSKIEQGKLELESEVFSLKDLMVQVRAVFSQQARDKGLTLDVRWDEAIPAFVRGDELRLRQVLMNLIGNAVKFTEKGSVTVKLVLAARREEEVQVRFDVQDTGIGIDAASMDRIFMPFTQSDASVTRKYGGTGLGLSICKEIIELFSDRKQTLQVKSLPQKGSDFYFYLEFPVAGAEKEQAAVSAETEELPVFAGQKVMIVDDSPVNRMVLREMLELCALKVYTAEGGDEALRLAGHESMDLVLMDIRMPGMDGYAVTKELRCLPGYAQVPVIALTADALQTVHDKIQETGMNDYLLKPVEHRLLYGKLQQQLGMVTERSLRSQAGNFADTALYFDAAACLEQIGGSRHSLRQIIECFLSGHAGDEQKLHALRRKGDWAAAAALLHQLKGTAGMLACMPLFQVCTAYEKESEIYDHERFREVWEQTLSALEAALAESKTEAVTAASPRELLERIYVLAADYDTEAVNLLEKYRELIAERMPVAEWEALWHYAQIFCFTGICRCLKGEELTGCIR